MVMQINFAWEGSGSQAGNAVWEMIGLVGPVVFAGLLAILVLKAIVRHRRYRVVGTFSDADQSAVHKAIAEAERKTVGEILPVVVERSDPHPGANWLASVLCLLIGSSLLAPWLPWDHPVYILLSQLGMGALGFGLAWLLPDFKRLFIFEDRATDVCMEQAFQEFYANGLHKTEAATGVLIFVSLLERRVILFSDEGIDAKVDAKFWSDTDDAVLQGIRKGSLRDGLIAGIGKAGDCLATHFPWKEGDRNEIPDRIIIRKE
jgi:putative membrane protein